MCDNLPNIPVEEHLKQLQKLHDILEKRGSFLVEKKQNK